MLEMYQVIQMQAMVESDNQALKSTKSDSDLKSQNFFVKWEKESDKQTSQLIGS